MRLICHSNSPSLKGQKGGGLILLFCIFYFCAVFTQHPCFLCRAEESNKKRKGSNFTSVGEFVSALDGGYPRRGCCALCKCGKGKTRGEVVTNNFPQTNRARPAALFPHEGKRHNETGISCTHLPGWLSCREEKKRNKMKEGVREMLVGQREKEKKKKKKKKQGSWCTP